MEIYITKYIKINMGNCQTADKPTFRTLNNSRSKNSILDKGNNTNNHSALNNYNNMVNKREVYRISRKKKKNPINISKLNYNRIKTLDNNTNNSTTSKSNTTDESDKYILSYANLDKFSRIKTLESQKYEGLNNFFSSKNIKKRFENKDYNKNFIEEKKRIRSKIYPNDKILEIFPSKTYTTKSCKDIKKNIINNLSALNHTSDFNILNKVEFKCIKTIKGHTDKIVSATELNNRSFATGSYDNTIKFWNLNSTIDCKKTIKEEGKVLCLLQFERNTLLSGTSKNNINLWDLLNSKLSFSFEGHKSWVNDLTKINNKYFASCSNDKYILIWDYYNRICINRLRGHIDCISSLITLSDGNLCSGSADLSIKIWDFKNGKCLNTLLGHKKWIKCLCQLTNDYIISGSDDKSIKVWSNNKCINTFLGHTRPVRTLCQINDYFFASGSFDKSIKIWDIFNFNCVHTIYSHRDLIIIIFIMKTGEMISCSNDHEIKIWQQILV